MSEEGVLPPADATAVIFISLRTGDDDTGYGAAAEAMAALVAGQEGYLGMDSTRGADGFGITISYWADEESAVAWRRNAEHTAIRLLGRERWYVHYKLIVSRVTRAYEWHR